MKFKYRRQNEDELNLSKGQIVKIIFKHDDGWWEERIWTRAIPGKSAFLKFIFAKFLFLKFSNNHIQGVPKQLRRRL